MICKFLKKLFGKKEKSEDLKWLEKKVKDSDKKLKEIEDEKVDLDDINNHFNE